MSFIDFNAHLDRHGRNAGFTFLRVDAYYQESIKGLIVLAGVFADVYRQKARVKKA
jgi:ribose/xylose/arabinose/galactoside ABC-type transport system permease subunit